jgi:hypothetical protein
MVGSCCVKSSAEEPSTRCHALDAALTAAPNLDTVCEALEARQAECVKCGSTAITPQRGRMYFNSGAVCCEAT